VTPHYHFRRIVRTLIGLGVIEMLLCENGVGRYRFLVLLQLGGIATENDFRSEAPCGLARLIESDVIETANLMLSLATVGVEIAKIVCLPAAFAHLEDEARGVGVPVVGLALPGFAAGVEAENGIEFDLHGLILQLFDRSRPPWRSDTRDKFSLLLEWPLAEGRQKVGRYGPARYASSRWRPGSHRQSDANVRHSGNLKSCPVAALR